LVTLFLPVLPVDRGEEYPDMGHQRELHASPNIHNARLAPGPKWTNVSTPNEIVNHRT